MQRQQRRVILDGAMGRYVEEIRRAELGHEGHHTQIGLQRFQLLDRLVGLEALGLIDRQIMIARRLGEGIDPPVLIGRAIDGDDFFTPLDQGIQNRLAKGLLSVDDNPHDNSIPLILFLTKLADFCRHDEIVFMQPLNLVGEQDDVGMAPTKTDIRVMAFFLGHRADLVDERERGDKIIEREFAVQPVAGVIQFPPRNLIQKAAGFLGRQRRYAALAWNASLLCKAHRCFPPSICTVKI